MLYGRCFVNLLHEDFMFQLAKVNDTNTILPIVTLKWVVSRYTTREFAKHRVAMVSSVLINKITITLT